MKLYGYAIDISHGETAVPSELAEVTVNAAPRELRRMAEFFMSCAAEMERMGASYDHIHLSDRMKEFQSSPHLVVMKEES